MKRIIGVILLIVGILSLGIGLSYNQIFKGNNNSKTNKKEELNIIVDKTIGENGKLFADILEKKILSKKTTLQEVKDLTNMYIHPNYIIIGEKNFFNYKSDFKTTDDLSKYDNLVKEYSDKLQDLYLSKSTFKIKENKENNVEVMIIPWNFPQYKADNIYLITKLLEFNKEPIDLATEEGSQKFNVLQYKAHTIAMKIMDKHLSDYDKGDKIEYTVKYENNSVIDGEYYEFYMAMNGHPDIVARNSELDQYLEEAIKDGLVDKDHPLELK